MENSFEIEKNGTAGRSVLGLIGETVCGYIRVL
jgi:hypothetical protein